MLAAELTFARVVRVRRSVGRSLPQAGNVDVRAADMREFDSPTARVLSEENVQRGIKSPLREQRGSPRLLDQAIRNELQDLADQSTMSAGVQLHGVQVGRGNRAYFALKPIGKRTVIELSH